MRVTEVYGHSDDLIEVNGNIHEEFNGDDELLTFSNGVLLRIRYDDDGIWRINVLAGRENVEVQTCVPDEDDRNYTDRARIKDAKWVVVNNKFVRGNETF